MAKRPPKHSEEESPSLISNHALRRLAERAGIRDRKTAEAFAEDARSNGLPPEAFQSGTELRDFLESKRRGKRLLIHRGVVMLFDERDRAITAYPLPAPLLAQYRKETNHD